MILLKYEIIRLFMQSQIKAFRLEQLKFYVYTYYLCVTTLVQGYLIQTLEGYTCMISPANFASCLAKVKWPTAFFSRKKMFFV